MKVFLDTNILLDYGEVRDDFIYAKAIMELGERGDVELFASYLSYANMGVYTPPLSEGRVVAAYKGYARGY